MKNMKTLFCNKTKLPAAIVLLAALTITGAARADSNGGDLWDVLERYLQALLAALREQQQEARHERELKKAGWRMVWADEFNGGRLDARNWEHEVNCWGGGNNEQQCYTPRRENSFLKQGKLHIVAREESFSGPAVNQDDPAYDPNDTSVTLPFTSARLRSKNKFDFKYGRVEIRAKPPAGQGMWSALWMLPTDYTYGIWPLSGEIDIMEAVNPGIRANEVNGTLHYGMAWPQWEVHGQAYTLAESAAENFHVYAIEWEADEIRWYVDGVHYQTQRSDGWYNYIWKGQDSGFGVANPRAPYDQAFHMIMNVAVGGGLPGAPDTGWSADREMLVDYVRVYQCKKNPATGKGCGAIDPAVAVNTGADAPTVNDYVIYADGPSTLTFNVGGGTVNNTLVPGQWELIPGNVVQTGLDIGGDHGMVWDVQFNGLGNIFLTSGDMSGVDGVDTGFNLAGGAGWRIHGELEFDMFVESIDPNTQLVVKLDSGWPNVGEKTIETPPVGQWSHVVVKLADLLAQPNPAGSGVDLSNVLNAFVLEPTGNALAHVRLDNIRLQCSQNPTAKDWQQDKTCALNPRVTPPAPISTSIAIYTDGINTADWNMGYQEFSTAGDHIIQSDVDLGGGNRALELLYAADGQNGVAWIQSAPPKNLSAFAGGKLVFDVRVLEWGANSSGLFIKMECSGGVCSTGDYSIGNSASLGTGNWNTIEIDIANLLANGGSNLDLSRVDVPLVIFPGWGDQQGVRFQLDNARIELDTLVIYENAISHWNIGVCCGGVIATELVDDVDPAHGNVVQFSYSTDTTVTFFQSATPMDLSGWAGGTVEFDLLVLAQPAGANWMMKVDCEFPCGTGDVPLINSIEGVPPPLGSWQHYTFRVDDLVARGLQLHHVNTPLVIFPAWGNQNGTLFRVDNIRLIKAP
jgi:beta-glucanase (GH16 family)